MCCFLRKLKNTLRWFTHKCAKNVPLRSTRIKKHGDYGEAGVNFESAPTGGFSCIGIVDQSQEFRNFFDLTWVYANNFIQQSLQKIDATHILYN